MIHFLEKRQHFIWFPLPHIKLRSLESLLGFSSQNIFVVGWNVSLLRQESFSSSAGTVEVLGQGDAGSESVVVQGVALLVVDAVPQLHQVQLILLHLYQPLTILLHPALYTSHLAVNISFGLFNHKSLAKLFSDFFHRARDYIIGCSAISCLLHEVRIAGGVAGHGGADSDDTVALGLEDNIGE